ncbi:MAG: hypothetical protein WA874_07925 [Chryseosolibacter sp.]
MENFKREIFEKLGNLFYALAADQEITTMESGELKMLLRKDWLTEKEHPSEDRVSEAAHLIGLTLDTLQNEKISAGTAYNNFVDFYVRHREQFSYALKSKIRETAEAITRMFSIDGRSNAHFEELKKLLEQSAEPVR